MTPTTNATHGIGDTSSRRLTTAHPDTTSLRGGQSPDNRTYLDRGIFGEWWVERELMKAESV